MMAGKSEEEILTDDIPDQLDPRVKKYWLTTNLVGVAVMVLFFLLPMILAAFLYSSLALVTVIMLIFAIVLLIAAIIGIILINANYKNITFLVKDETLTINRGILFKRSLTIPFNRVQNVDIFRGPLESAYGISTIQIQTAGWGGGMLGGRLKGISNPELLRDIILKRVVKSKNNGI
jgi:membrane protein YdbS with pleckstrin-like domain